MRYSKKNLNVFIRDAFLKLCLLIFSTKMKYSLYDFKLHLESSWATGLTSASPWCRIGASVVFDFIPRDVVLLVVNVFFFCGTGTVVVDVFLAGFLATHVRQSLDSFISSGHAHEVVGIVWLILQQQSC